VKILITTEQYYPIKSGVSSVVTAIAEELYSNGHEIYVATGFENRDKLIHNGVQILEFKVYGGFGNYYRGEIDRYKDFILNFDCDILINECVQTWSTDLLLKYLPLIKAQKFLHSHGFSLLSYKTKNPLAYVKSKFYYYFLHKFLKNYDHIFLLHNKTVETQYLNKYKINTFSYLPNGVNSEFLVDASKIESKDKYLINISNYYPMKNQEFLMEAFYKSKTNYKLILIGSAVLKNYLEKLKELKIEFDLKYGVKNVEFLLNISRDETIDYLKSATLFLHSSELEVFPMVIVESMAKRVPYVSTDVGNVSTLPGGYVVQSVDDMATKIDYLLSNTVEYEKKSLEGFFIVENKLNWSNITCDLERYFKSKKKWKE